MEKKKVTRKLAAILATDMVGFSRLMEKDEAGTVARQRAHRAELIDPKITEHNGRIVKTTGDGLLVEFASVVDAVQCAVEMQHALRESESAASDDARIRYRMGVNLGDVIVEGDDILGDGVNVAARLEALAKPGEVLISGTAFDQLKKKLEYGYHFRGERKVKNIAEPVRIYSVRPDAEAGTVAGSRRWMPQTRRWAAVGLAFVVIVGVAFWWRPWAPSFNPAIPLPGKPSIAVLPFNNLSGDKTQDHLADGLSENIIQALAKVSEMLVIARNSSFTYRGKAVKVQRVAEELGVRYVLEGSVQTSGDRIRVTAQLIDAIKGHHLWSERYDRKLAELFAVQDEITQKIVVALQVKLTEGEQARVRARSTNNLQAWGLFVEAQARIERYTKQDNAGARALVHQAVKLDPNYASAWRTLAWTHWLDARFGWSPSQAKSFQMAVTMAQKAVTLAPEDSETQALMASIHLFRRDFDKAVAAGRAALQLGPNMGENKAIVAITMNAVGGWDQSIQLIRSAMRLHPRFPSWYLVYLSRAYAFKEDPRSAISTAKKGLARAESDDLRAGFHLVLAWVYSETGQMETARKHVAAALKLDPGLSLRRFRSSQIYRNPVHQERVLTALRKVGLPE